MENRNRNRNRNSRFDESGNDYSQNDYRNRDSYSQGSGNYNRGFNDRNRDYDDYNRSGNYGNQTNWRHESVQQWNDNDNDRNWRNSDSNYGNDRNWRSDFDRRNDMDRNWNSDSNWRDSDMNRNRSGFGGSYGGSSYGNDFGSRGSDRYRSNDFSGSDSGRYGSDYGRGFDRTDYNRGDDYRNRDNDRGWWDRTTDEVSSWFGDEDAERRRRMDKMNEGKHRGRGPKGYKRSDERIKEDVNDRLSDDHYIDASEIEVNVSNGEVTLSGTIDSKSAKRRAEDVAESISGVNNVQNNLRVSQKSNADTLGNTQTGSTGMSGTGTSRSTTQTGSATNGGAMSTAHQNGHKSKATT